MDLTDQYNEAAAFWLMAVCARDDTKAGNLAWRIPTSELYHAYLGWVRGKGSTCPLTMEQLWDVIQCIWPTVKIVGKKGSRAYTGLRWRNR